MNNFYRFEQKNNVLRILSFHENQIVGYINPWKYRDKDWEIMAVAAEHGYGFKMYELAMDFLYPNFIIPSRNKSIQPELFSIYEKFILREDIESLEITSDDSSYIKISETYNTWFNRRYRLKQKLDQEFNETTYQFMNKHWNTYFSKKYPWQSRSETLK